MTSKTLKVHKNWHSQHMKKPNPFLESSNLPLLAAKSHKGYIKHRILNYREEILMYTPKNSRGSNIFEPSVSWLWEEKTSTRFHLISLPQQIISGSAEAERMFSLMNRIKRYVDFCTFGQIRQFNMISIQLGRFKNRNCCFTH